MLLSTQKITWSAIFIALGVLLPILFHTLGIGSVFLPMFWPVALCAYFLDTPYAVAVGAITPIISTLLTGMPPLSPPIVYIMIFELAFLAGITSLFYHKTSLGIFGPLLIGLIISRFVLFITVIPLASILGLPPRIASIVTVLKGMPGVAVILIIVPILVRRLNKEVIFGLRCEKTANSSKIF